MVVCLVLEAFWLKLENGKMKGTETGSGDAWGQDNALLV